MKYIPFENWKKSKEDAKLQILMRGTIGLTSKSDEKVKELMSILYEDWIHLVLIKGYQDYNRNEKIPDNRRYNEIDYSLPILNMTSRPHVFLEHPRAQIYNKIEDYPVSSDKVTFSKIFEDSKYLPKTAFTLKNAKNLQFPIIAKPAKGFSAQGIEIFKTIKDLEKADTSKFDLYSEAKDIKTEFRLFVMNGRIIHLAERIKNSKNDKSVGVKKSDEKIDLVYIDQDLDTFPPKLLRKLLLIDTEVRQKVNLDFYDIDLILDTDDNFWIPEINGAPGIGPSMFLPIYREWINMVYHRPLKDYSENILKSIADQHQKFIKETYPTEYNSSINPV